MPKKKGSEIQIARGRLKGVLQELVAPSDDEVVSDESEKKIPAPTRGRPPKRLKKEIPEPTIPLHESYIMKLFDRSLDLAKYNENTALYPICRAWMADQPRSSSIKNMRIARTPSPEIREKNIDLVKKLTNGTVKEIITMPAPKSLDIPRVPSPLPEQKDFTKESINMDYDLDAPHLSRETIMSQHRKRWKNVKSKWTSHAKAYQQRYVLSYELLDALYKQ